MRDIVGVLKLLKSSYFYVAATKWKIWLVRSLVLVISILLLLLIVCVSVILKVISLI